MMNEYQRKRQRSVGVDPREDSSVLRLDAYRIRGYKFGNSRRGLPLRVLALWVSALRSCYSRVGRQEREVSDVRTLPLREIREPIDVILPCRSKIKKWAFENAYVLIVMAIMFGITWLAIFILGVHEYAK